MWSHLRRFYLTTLAALRYFGHIGYHAFGFLSRIFPPFIRFPSSNIEKTTDSEDNGTSTAICDTYTIQLHPQHDLKLIGIGASAQVYEVDDQIVLKSSWVFEKPGSSATENDRWHYASDTLFQSNLLQNERTVLQLLQRRPHPHIIKAIDADQPESIYLRRYHSLSENETPAQLHRIRWYRDLTSALCHIHSLGIAHADIRIDNVLFEHDRVILCDFSATSPLGQSNPVFPDAPLPVNGPSSTLSEATDMFAMGSFIFQLEHGAKPELVVDSNGTLALPKIQTDHPILDTIIRKAWLGQYDRTSEMLEHIDSIGINGASCAHDTGFCSGLAESLRVRIRKWRKCRENKFGCVLNGLLSDEQLQALADCYGLDKDADLQFNSHRTHLTQTDV
ncbi:unnamed protein product [Penicillium salamii]|uniref:Protein kinase domain-containing protein n=1 Tax=Penicillium salamii TaxID=1612424 RepID=A0A9W4NWX8_9EURO|nr:unnamed protein product [Penicillium salamii]